MFKYGIPHLWNSKYPVSVDSPLHHGLSNTNSSHILRSRTVHLDTRSVNFAFACTADASLFRLALMFSYLREYDL